MSSAFFALPYLMNLFVSKFQLILFIELVVLYFGLFEHVGMGLGMDKLLVKYYKT